ncbi:MAG: hypothetical protein IJE22_08180 [Oscillibacter sp.]|nr:hypothetical protein [Oscillibacter sp.]
MYKTTGGVTTEHFYDGSNVILDMQGSTAVGEYIYGVGLVSNNAGSTPVYYLQNGHGDVTHLTNSSAAVTKTYTYDAFGNEESPVATDANPFRYGGQYYDKETGTYYLRARYYDPVIGRFTREDPHWNTGNMIYGDDPLQLNNYNYAPSLVAIIQSGNLYAYAMNNPVKYVDENGESAIGAVLAWLTTPVGQTTLGAAVGGISSGITYVLDGKSFWVGAANGAVSGGIATVSGVYGGPAGAFVGSALGSAAGTVVETFIVDKAALTDPQARDLILSSAIEGAIAGIPAAYWRATILEADKLASAARELMDYNPELGMLLENFFSGISTSLSAKEDQ